MDKTKSFLEVLKDNEELKEKFQNFLLENPCDDIDETIKLIIDFSKENNLEISQEEIEKLKKKMNNNEPIKKKLSLDDLDQISGGKMGFATKCFIWSLFS